MTLQPRYQEPTLDKPDLDLFQNSIRHLGRLGLSAQVRRQVLSLAQDGVDRGVDPVRRFRVAKVGKEEGC